MQGEDIVIRVYTDDCRYRFQLNESDTFGKLLSLIAEKTGTKIQDITITTQNDKKLNIKADKKIKGIVYLAHGSILKATLPNREKGSALPETHPPPQKQELSRIRSVIPSKCSHPPNVRCSKCLSSEQKNQHYVGNGLLTINNPQEQEQKYKCDHGPRTKCLKCLGTSEKPQSKIPSPQIFMTPSKPKKEDSKIICNHSPNVKCYNCMATSKKKDRIKELMMEPKQKTPKTIKSQIKPAKCQHGENGRCLNCYIFDIEKESLERKQNCTHGANAKCIHCVNINDKAAHIPFDEFLLRKRGKCSNHGTNIFCPSCLPVKNLKLTLDKDCKQHEPYPKALCLKCMPQSVSIKRQEYRHVDYVQFMNSNQVHNFIQYWLEEKYGVQMRVGFLYGYFAEDPFYKNGIRAIVEAIYEPKQVCTYDSFEIKDSDDRKMKVELIAESLGLQKLGIIISTHNDKVIFTQSDVRMIARMQQEASLEHSSGYRFSNFITTIVRQPKQGSLSVQPQVFMISDQGQALETAGMFIKSDNKQKMKVKLSDDKEILPVVYSGAKAVEEFQIQFLLVKIASGFSKDNKFSVLKNNEFPPLSRAVPKKATILQYLQRNQRKQRLVRLGDFNLLLFIAEAIHLDSALEIALSIANEAQMDDSLVLQVDKKLELLLR